MLTITNLTYRYPDGTPALRGIDLAIAAGEKVALLGVNGAGKSTLLLHLNGTLRPASGAIVVDGLPVTPQNLRQIRARVGLVFQDPDDQLFSPTVFDDVAFGPLYMGLAPAEAAQRVQQALQAVGMMGYERRAPHRLSLGQRKRVALATVLAMQPSLLALDEPSAGLDPRARRALSELLRALPQTMLVSTHDLALAADVFPRAIVLAEGRVVADEATASLLAHHSRLLQYGLI
ncbi:ABC transporter ATP-binding protein [Chloroflexus sp.]|uniref:energy-coupling factor ABC transporter ATP-binding protein n=1 Tax=Chloroflexus sp. TaxID=1904827 RepID=UPI00298F2D5F|nr:ABC transporter ATP-binding protein [Chloroflexus sp.]MCX7858966.1 energy-coupling factor ABC transporter ATP-binding protein [Chloroflexus sp.]MDW8404942.1 ABC transporter ATP-binding protein [Chloroflexus sp.]